MATLVRCGLLLAFLVSTQNTFAHHSDSMYDLERLITLRGVVSGITWSNPHVELELEGLDAAGQAVTWVVEIASPGSLVRNGVRSEMFVIGESVEVAGHPPKDAGRIAAWGRSVLREDGSTISLPPKSNFVRIAAAGVDAARRE